MKNSGRFLCGCMNTKFINVSMVVVVFIFSCGINFINGGIRKKYDDAVLSQQIFIACNDASDVFKRQSDNLTQYVTAYINNMSQSEIDGYYSIIDNNLREQEIEKAEEYDVDCNALKQALDLSNKLSEKETHAFKLIVAARNMDYAVPKQVMDYQLTAEEESMTAEEKISTAKKLVLGRKYRNAKKEIYSKLDDFENGVMLKTQEKLQNESKEVSTYLKYQYALEVLENIIVILISLVIYRKITVVLEEYSQSISKKQPVEPKGTTELQYLGEIFNDYIYIQNIRENELRYKAETDPLTQVANRRTLEDFMDNKLRQKGARGAFVFFDIDEFKSINDAYGHDVGDIVLKNFVADVKNSFREIDFVGRFGGDEFVVWIEDVSIENRDFIKERVAHINKGSVNVADTVIKLTMSAGVTFCKEGDNYKDVLRRADEALYDKKRTGKKGCSIYEELKNTV